MTAVRFLDEKKPLSGPFCWAFPDMLVRLPPPSTFAHAYSLRPQQVGQLATAAHDRAHFGSWAIISAPLYLSFDMTDSRRMDRVWPLITNREVSTRQGMLLPI